MIAARGAPSLDCIGLLLDSVQLRGFTLTPQEFAAKLNWEGQKIYWGLHPPLTSPSPAIPALLICCCHVVADRCHSAVDRSLGVTNEERL